MSTKESPLNYQDYQYILIAISLARGNDEIKEMPQIDDYLSELYVKVKALYNKKITSDEPRSDRLTNGDLG